MATRDILRILRSSVPLLRPKDRCPGELYVNFADGIVGYIDPAGAPQDIGPFVFPDEAALEAFGVATNPREGLLAFANDSFWQRDTLASNTPVPGWRQILLGGDADLDEVLRLIAEETVARIDGDATLSARVSDETSARIAGDVAVANQVTILSASVDTRLTDTNARITTESTARADADSALATQLNSLEATVTTVDSSLSARITTESQARADGDAALASRTTTLEASSLREIGNTGNLLDNAFLTRDAVGWNLGTWTRATFGSGPSATGLTTVGSVNAAANSNQFRPLPSGALLLRLHVRRTQTEGPFNALLLWADATGQPLPNTVLDINPTAANVWQLKEHRVTPPAGAASFVLQFDPNGQGTYDVAAPLLAPLSADFTTDINVLSARITTEEQARVAGDTALASRSTVLEAQAIVTSSRQNPGLFESFDQYADNDALRKAVDPQGVSPAQIGLTPVSDGGGRAMFVLPNTFGFFVFGTPKLPVTGGRVHRVTFDIQAVGGPVRLACGVRAFDANGIALLNSAGSDHWVVAGDLTLSEGQRRRLTGYLSLFRPADDPLVGVPAPDITKPGAWVNGTASASWGMFIFGGQAGTLVVHTAEVIEVTDVADNRGTLDARITTEEQARVAGDTALATRTTTLEARSKSVQTLGYSWDFSVYSSLEEMELAGWTAFGGLLNGSWALEPDPLALGGVALVHTAISTEAALFGPPISYGASAHSIDRQDAPVVEFSASYVRPSVGLPMDSASVEALLGAAAYDASGELLGGDFSVWQLQGGRDPFPISAAGLVQRGFGARLGAVGAGNRVGFPAPSPGSTTMFPNGTVRLRPLCYFIGMVPGVKVRVVSGSVRVAQTTQEFAVSIQSEQTARIDGDTALAQQIQQIIAEGAQGTQTFFQATAPTNPEPGWVWFKDNGPGIADEIFRWSGSAWVEIDVSEPVDLSLVNARITEESTARVQGDNALASRTSIVEANVANFGPRITANESGLATANTRITNEQTARADADGALGVRIDGVSASANTNAAAITAESSARASADSALSTSITNLTASVNTKDAATNARVTAESQARADGDAVLASRTSSVESNVGALAARVTTSEQAIDGIEAEYAVSVDANGHVVGFRLISGAGGGLFAVRADSFSVSNPGVPSSQTPIFEVVDGQVRIREAIIGQLSAGVIKLDDLVLDTNAAGELTIKGQAISTELLAANAAVRPFTYSQIQASEVTFPPNVWNTLQLNGVPAEVIVNNPAGFPGLVKFDVNVLIRNGGSDSDTASFRVQRGDGLILPTQYPSMWIDGRSGQYSPLAMTFFDNTVLPGASNTYRLQMNSNDRSPIKAVHILGLLFKNATPGAFGGRNLESDE
jgi:hypothetical protein